MIQKSKTGDYKKERGHFIMHKMPTALLIILLLLPLPGCHDINEIDDLVYVISLGLDKGSHDNIKTTVQFTSLKEGGDQETGGGKKSSTSEKGKEGFDILSVEAPTVFGALNLLNTSLTRRLTFMHLKIIVFSEDLAGEGLSPYLGILAGYWDLRRPITVLVARSGAENFINNNISIIGTNPSKTIELITRQSESTGFYSRFTDRDFYSNIKSTYIQPIAILAGVNSPKAGASPQTGIIYNQTAGDIGIKGDLKRNTMGTAVFDGDKMVGELNGDETRVLLMARGEFKRAFMDVRDPQNPKRFINFDVRPARKPKIKTWFEDGKPFVHLTLNIEANWAIAQTAASYADPELLPIAENALKEYIREILDEIIKKSQHEFNSDIFGFGRFMAAHFLTIQEWEGYEWPEKFKDAHIATEVAVNIRRPGISIYLSPVRKAGE